MTTISERYKLLKQTRKSSLMKRLRSLSLEHIREAFADESSNTIRNSLDGSCSLAPDNSISPEIDERMAYGAVEQEDSSELLLFEVSTKRLLLESDSNIAHMFTYIDKETIME